MKRLFVFILNSILVLGGVLVSSCTKDPSVSGGTFVQVSGPEIVHSFFGYNADGQKIGGGTFVNDVFFLNTIVNDDISYASKAYEYQGLVGGKGCYLYYYYCVDYSKTTTVKFTFQGNNLCVYSEEYAVKDASWTWECTFCSHPSSSYASRVGDKETIHYGDGSTVFSTKTYSVLSDPNAGKDDPRYVLYEGETYIEIYVSGNEAHIIKRLPSLYDYGTFKIGR